MRRYVFTALFVVILITLFTGISAGLDTYKAAKFNVAPTIDGKLSDWSGVTGVFLTGSTTVTGTVDGKDVYKNWETLGVETWTSDADLSATWYVAWDDNNLYFAALVKDDIQKNDQTDPASIWNGDGVQFTIDPTNAKKDYANYVYEYGYALAAGKPMVYRWSVNPASKGENSKYAIVRDNTAGTTTYEVAIPKGDIAPADISAGKTLGFSVIFNENDTSGGQGGWLGWGAHAIVYGKNAANLNDLAIVGGVVSAVNPGGKLASVWGSIKK